MIRRWVTCQIGAREHYALPRALRLCGRPATLVTDFWRRAGARRLPQRLAQRAHTDLPEECVVSFNRSYLAHELASRALGRRGWAAIGARNRWFEQKAAAGLAARVGREADRPVVFAYSYAALGIFDTARTLGCPTVLGQIDPGPVEWRLLAELQRRHGRPVSDQPPPEYWDRWRRECAAADCIVVNSPWAQQGLEAEGVPREKIRVVPLAYEPAAAAPAGPRVYPEHFSSGRPLRILYLGQVILRKGVAEMIGAIRQVSDQPIEWTIVGDGDSQLMDELRSCPACRVVGAVPRDEAAQYYGRADVFMLPTHSDGYALTQLEAASHGLPLIVSRNCGAVVRDGETGWELDEVSAEAIAGAVLEAVNDPGLLGRFAAAQCELPRRGLRELGGDLVELEGELVGVRV